MTLRQERILRFCNWEGFGLEIGASFNPIASKKSGFHMEVLDYLSREELLQKYKGQPSTPENIEELIEDVDYVWRGESYAKLVRRHYDFIISSHLMEHVPDVIGHINDCCEILNDGGVYSLAIPDKRFSFDIMRKETTIDEIIDRIGNNQYSDEMIINYVTGVVKNGNDISWGKLCTERNFTPVYSAEEMEQVKNNPRDFDLDIHASVFTPQSFAKIMDELYNRGLIQMPLMYVDEDTEYGEFFAVFKKGATQEDKVNFGKSGEIQENRIKENCWIDRMDVENGFLVLEGFSSVDGRPPADTTLLIGKAAIHTTRKMRPDLSPDINSNKYGFFCIEPISSLKRGVHRFQIVSQNDDGKKVCYTPTFLIIKKEKIIDIRAILKAIKLKIYSTLKY